MIPGTMPKIFHGTTLDNLEVESASVPPTLALVPLALVLIPLMFVPGTTPEKSWYFNLVTLL